MHQPPRRTTAWRVGDLVADLYRVLSVNERGGMGVVYRVRHLAWHLDLAVKSPRPEFFGDSADLEAFVREAETWASLGLHPHVCACHYVRVIDGIPRVFAEFVEGGSLRDWVGSRRLYAGPPDEVLARILDIAIQLARGLEHAHARGLVHQDVKPANVLLTLDGVAKVTDFGLARARAVLCGPGNGHGGPLADGDSTESVLVTGTGMTPAYASPEQAAGRPLGRRTDIWSFAVSVLELFTGAVLWPAGPLADTALVQYLRGGRPDPVAPAMPGPLAELLGRCLRSEPSQRPPTMAQIGTELGGIYERSLSRPYRRPVPKAAGLRADELNNRALSLLDLGREGEAESAFDEALAADPQHLEATYNSALVQWRAARVSDDTVVGRLEAARASAGDPWQAQLLLAQVHLERGDVDAAWPLLQSVAKRAGGEPDVAATLREAHTGDIAEPRREYRIGHADGRMLAACLSADGRVLLAGGAQETGTRWRLWPAKPVPDAFPLRLWDVAGDRCLRVLDAHHDWVHAADISIDGRLAVSGSADGAVLVWDLNAGRLVHTLIGHTGLVSSVRISADGRMAVSGSLDHTVRLWDLAPGQCVHVLGGHTREVRSVCVSRDARLAASAADDSTIRLWDVHYGRCLGVLDHDRHVKSIDMSPDGRRLVAGDLAGAVWLWDLTRGRAHRIPDAHARAVEHASISVDGHFAVTGGADGSIRLWNVETGRCLRTYQGHRDLAVRLLTSNFGLRMPLRLSADGRRVLSANNEYVVRFWGVPRGYLAPLRLCRPRSHTELDELAERVRGLVDEGETALAEGRVAAALATLTKARAVPGHERSQPAMAAWRRLTRSTVRVGVRAVLPVRVIDLPTSDYGFLGAVVRISTDGRYAICTASDKTVRLWDLDRGVCVHTLEAPGHPVNSDDADLSRDGRYALTGDGFRKVQLFDAVNGRHLRTLGEHNVTSLSVAMGAGGRLALSAAGDYLVKVWDVETGDCLRTFTVGDDRIHRVRLSADGRLAVAAAQSGHLLRWDVDTGASLPSLGGGRRMQTVALCADGQIAVTGDWGNAVRVWDLTRDRRERVLTGHTHPVSTVDISSDGRFAVSGSGDGTIRIWDLTRGACVRVVEGHGHGVGTVSLSGDARVMVSVGSDPTLRVWEIDWELQAREAADWHDGARPFLHTFLRLRSQAGRQRPSWTAEDFDHLLEQLRDAGYGWLRPAGVRATLQAMAAAWNEPPPLYAR